MYQPLFRKTAVGAAVVATLALASVAQAGWGSAGSAGSAGSLGYASHGSHGSYGGGLLARLHARHASVGSTGSTGSHGVTIVHRVGSHGSTGSVGSHGSSGSHGGLLARIHAWKAARHASRGSHGSHGSTGSSGSRGYISPSAGSSGGSSGGVSAPVYSAPVQYSAPVHSAPVHSAPVEYSAPVQGEPTPAVPAVQISTGSAKLTVNVPENAKIYVNDRLTTTPGAQRVFVSRGLKSTANYRYEVRAEYELDGQVVTKTKTVQLTSGSEQAISFDFADVAKKEESPETKVTVNVPADAKVRLSGHLTKGTGESRVFSTTALPAGEAWSNYEVSVTVNRNGRDITKTETVTVNSGDELTLNFDFDSFQVAAK